MLQRILVPQDGSQLAEAALPHALKCAQATNSLLILAHVLQTSDIHIDVPAVDPLDWRLRKMEATLYMEEIAERLAGEGVNVETALLQGEAAECITKLAEERDVDLIVMGSHGRGGLNGCNVSSVVQEIILTTHTSVMIAPSYRASVAEPGEQRYRTIVAPLDGSRRAECVLPMVRALADLNQAQIQLVTVVDRPEMPQRAPLSRDDVDFADEVVAHSRAEVEKYLTQLQSRIKGDVSRHVLQSDDVVGTLHNFLKGQDADLVVFSAHGHSGSGACRYGSLVTSFIAYGSVPMLIIQDLPPEEIAKSEAQVAAEEILEQPLEVRTVVNASSAA